jgi:hypothetical protein
MFHGRKKQTSTPLTPEQQAANKEKLSKILLINQTMLAKRADKEYT